MDTVWMPWLHPAHRVRDSGGAIRGVTAWMQGEWKAPPTLRRAATTRMGATGSGPAKARAASAREMRPMAPSETIMMIRRSKRSAKAPVNRESTPWGTMAAMVARESTAGEPVRSVRYQIRAYWETMLLRMDRACPVQRRTNFCFQ